MNTSAGAAVPRASRKLLRAITESLERRQLLTATIAGTIWNDANANGVWDDPDGLSGWTVDLVQNGSTVQQTTSNEYGKFWFVAPAGAYSVAPEPTSGFRPTNTNGSMPLALSDGQTTSPALGFTNAPGGTITGSVFSDDNDNGYQDLNEPGLANWTVYLDLNHDGRLDPGDPTATTGADGSFTLSQIVSDRTYAVRVAAPNGYHVTGPASYDASVTNGTSTPVTAFGYAPGAGVTISGYLANDVNDNAQIDGQDTVLANWTVNLLQSGQIVRQTMTNQNGYFSFIEAPGTYTVRPVVMSGFRVTYPSAGTFTTSLADGHDASTVMAFTNAPGATITGTVYDDANGNGAQDVGDPVLQGWTVYLDLHHDGQLDADDPTAITDGLGHYSFLQLTAGTYTVRVVQQPNTRQTLPAQFTYSLAVTNGTVSSGNDFSFVPGAGVNISGLLVNDTTAAGIWNGNPGLAGWTVYLDANNNGQLDPGEPSTTTAANGTYAFNQLPAGSYTIRYVPQAGYTQTFPGPDHLSLTLSPGDTSINNVFGLTAANGLITGSVVNDANGRGLAQCGVYVDANNNGSFDPNERWTVTDASGHFSFGLLTPGTYTIRVDPDTRDWVPSPGSVFSYSLNSDGVHPSASLNFLYHQDVPAKYDPNHLVDYFLIGGTSTDDSRRTVGDPVLQAGGWTGFVALNVKPDLAWGVRRIGLHNPFGAITGEPYFEADQYLQAQAAGLHWLTDGFVSAWQPITASGVEVIAYIGNPEDTPSFQALAASGDTAGWMARFNACVAPIVQAHMSIGIDHSAGMSQNSLLWQAVQGLQAQGVKVYIESRPAEPTPYLWSLPTISLNSSWSNGDPYVHPDDPVFHWDAKNSELPAGNAVRLIDGPPPGKTWSDVTWIVADIKAILQAGDVAAIGIGSLRQAGYTLQQILTPAPPSQSSGDPGGTGGPGNQNGGTPGGGGTQPGGTTPPGGGNGQGGHTPTGNHSPGAKKPQHKPAGHPQPTPKPQPKPHPKPGPKPTHVPPPHKPHRPPVRRPKPLPKPRTVTAVKADSGTNTAPPIPRRPLRPRPQTQPGEAARMDLFADLCIAGLVYIAGPVGILPTG